MGREQDPFQKRQPPQDGRRRGEYGDEPKPYGDGDFDYDEYGEGDEYEREDDFDEEGLNNSKRRSGPPPLPPFSSRNRNTYPRRSYIRRAPEAATPRPPARPATHSKRHVYLSDESQPSGRRPAEQPPSRRRPGESYQRSEEQRPRVRPTSLPAERYGPARPRKRSVWPIFLGGCAAGAISLILALAALVWIGIHSVTNGVPGPGNASSTAIPQQNTQTVSLSSLSQLIVCDSAGNISLTVDSNAASSDVVVKTTKMVQTADQNLANQTFGQIAVSVVAQPSGATLTCDALQTNPPTTSNTAATATAVASPTATKNSVLSVNVVFPATQAGQVSTVDVAITLPGSLVPAQDPTHAFTSTLISMPNARGTVNVDGVNGIMNLHDASGDMTIKNSILVDGTNLHAQGKLTFDGSIWPKALSSNPRANIFLSGAFQVDVALPEMSSVMLNATTDARTTKITSDFPITVDTSSDGSSAYYGPFNPAMLTDKNTAPLLTLQASSGNISIHKAKTSPNAS
jgi:hypothetical protein